MGRDIDGGASNNIGNEVKVEREKGGATNKVRFASEGADSTGSESTVIGASVDNGGGANNGGCGGVSVGAVPRISRMRLREILQHAEGGCVKY